MKNFEEMNIDTKSFGMGVATTVIAGITGKMIAKAIVRRSIKKSTKETVSEMQAMAAEFEREFGDDDAE